MEVIVKYLTLCALLTVCSAQIDPNWLFGSQYDTQLNARSRPTDQVGNSNSLVNSVQEQRAVEQQNRALEQLFARSFPATVPEEFRDAIVQLYFRSQRELDVCAEFLWDIHLLKEYRRCATLTRLTIRRQVKVLADDVRELTVAEYDYLE
ncbi:uncharacterized protein LOC131425670 [Malaya genurostris]|uniref:uncharacterized protein LOC131425670 n=1 Tax=Malaya genurostris TaxID=325434 RepID=UPI0026F3BD8A|nr:uncharacterized protein LOC131425670 [Malaya genurostris]